MVLANVNSTQIPNETLKEGRIILVLKIYLGQGWGWGDQRGGAPRGLRTRDGRPRAPGRDAAGARAAGCELPCGRAPPREGRRGPPRPGGRARRGVKVSEVSGEGSGQLRTQDRAVCQGAALQAVTAAQSRAAPAPLPCSPRPLGRKGGLRRPRGQELGGE